MGDEHFRPAIRSSPTMKLFTSEKKKKSQKLRGTSQDAGIRNVKGKTNGCLYRRMFNIYGVYTLHAVCIQICTKSSKTIVTDRWSY